MLGARMLSGEPSFLARFVLPVRLGGSVRLAFFFSLVLVLLPVCSGQVLGTGRVQGSDSEGYFRRFVGMESGKPRRCVEFVSRYSGQSRAVKLPAVPFSIPGPILTFCELPNAKGYLGAGFVDKDCSPVLEAVLSGKAAPPMSPFGFRLRVWDSAGRMFLSPLLVDSAASREVGMPTDDSSAAAGERVYHARDLDFFHARGLRFGRVDADGARLFFSVGTARCGTVTYAVSVCFRDSAWSQVSRVGNGLLRSVIPSDDGQSTFILLNANGQGVVYRGEGEKRTRFVQVSGEGQIWGAGSSFLARLEGRLYVYAPTILPALRPEPSSGADGDSERKKVRHLVRKEHVGAGWLAEVSKDGVAGLVNLESSWLPAMRSGYPAVVTWGDGKSELIVRSVHPHEKIEGQSTNRYSRFVMPRLSAEERVLLPFVSTAD